MNQEQNTAFKSSTLWFLTILLAIIWFGTLNYRHLIPTDEGRYAEMAREMLVSGDWLTPRYNDYKYFEKPPLQIWATALAFKLFGLGEWQARLWSGLTSFMTILAIGITAGTLFGRRTGVIASLILASSPIWVLGGHFNSLDMGLSAFMSLSLFAMLLGQSSTKGSGIETFWMLVCWANMGLAVLSKGLIGVALPGLVLIAYSITSFDWQIWKRLHLIKGLILLLILTAPWFIWISQVNPEFPNFFFIKEHFERFTTDQHQRVAPWFYFFPLLIVGFLPWLLQLPKSLALAFTERSNREETFKPLWMCLIWSVFIFAFFSKSQSKLPGYIIPIFPALAIMAAVALDKSLFTTSPSSMFVKQKQSSILWTIQTFGFACLFALGYLWLPEVSKTGKPYEAASYATYTYVIGIALATIILGCLIAWLIKTKSPQASITVYAFAFLLMTTIAGNGHETVGRQLSGVDLANQTRPFIKEGAPFYSVNMLDHTVPFYLGKTMIMVQYPDELAFGISQEPDKWLPSIEEFIKQWQSDENPNALAIMRPVTFEDLKNNQNLEMELVAQDPERVVVKKISSNSPN